LPPLDKREDDRTILDEERLLRRIHPQQLVPDENNGKFRVSSAAFRDRELSVVIESALRVTDRSPADTVARHPSHSLVAIRAGLARQKAQRVFRGPDPDEPAHGLVCGNKNSKCASEFARSAEWVVPHTAPNCER
jgi:hypothetical protein